MFRVVCFDFDGVLADSVPIKDGALAYLFRDHPPEIRAEAERVWLANKGVFRPERIRRVFQEAAGTALDEAQLDAQVAIFVDQVVERTVEAPAIAGSDFFLETCHNLIPCYVVSAGPQEEVRDIVRRRGLEGYFRGVYGGPEKKRDILMRTLDENGCAPHEGLFLGDSLSDQVAAEAVGMCFLGVVAPGLANPFPESVLITPDLTQPLAGLEP